MSKYYRLSPQLSPKHLADFLFSAIEETPDRITVRVVSHPKFSLPQDRQEATQSSITTLEGLFRFHSVLSVVCQGLKMTPDQLRNEFYCKVKTLEYRKNYSPRDVPKYRNFMHFMEENKLKHLLPTSTHVPPKKQLIPTYRRDELVGTVYFFKPSSLELVL